MDALEFLKEQKRMCSSYKNCDGCPAWSDACKLDPGGRFECEAEEKLKIVNEWAISHPRKTRQSLFLEQYPEARIGDDGVLQIYPCLISASHRNARGNCATMGCECPDCRKEFWGQEVE